jgi:hypothetical protein
MVNKLSGGESFNSRKDKFKNQPWISNKAERN